MQYGLLGEHLPHSHSPKIHARLGNRGYVLFEKSPEEVEAFLKERKFHGINVTIPYKETVMPMCDCLDAIAVEIGAVNTVVNCGGKLFGTNTDYNGFIFMCNRAGIDFSGKNVLILGSGGTSKMVKVAARHLGAADIKTVSRKGAVNYENVYSVAADANIIVNTTPVGMYPSVDAKPIELSKFSMLTGVVDVVYNPLRTRLLQEADTLGIPAAGGLSMLVAQAAFADTYFRGVKHSGGEIVNIINKIELALTNIILIGMPGCGKSTIGKILAKKTGRMLFDIDAEIVARAGRTIPEIFESEGEGAFRDMESEITKNLCLKGGTIIACGGGTILREENRKALKQNGKVVYIRRELSQLARGGRPLSSGDGAVEKLYSERAPIYETCADITVESLDSVGDTANAVFKEIFK